MYAIIDQDLKIALDPYAGTIAEMDEANVVSNLAVLGDRIDKLEVLSNDLMNSLDPTTAPFLSYPNREGIYMNLGRVTNFFYGMTAGLLITALLLFALGGR
jgi:tetrahydromethanopterin S-methyltransferase subunit B